jgi:membrane protease YdiL (CAAX protease family)
VALLGAALLGIGLAPWVQVVAQLQKLVWPGDSENTRAVTKLVADALNQNALLTIVGIGVLAGVCEELFYRGPLQTAFVKKMRPWAAIVLVGILFGAIHMDLRGLPLRAALGALFGWMVWRGKSIYPAMIAHGIFDSTSVALFYWAMRRVGAEQIAAAAEKPGFHVETSDLVALAVGAVLICAGAWLFRRTLPAREKPEPRAFSVTPEPVTP